MSSSQAGPSRPHKHYSQEVEDGEVPDNVPPIPSSNGGNGNGLSIKGRADSSHGVNAAQRDQRKSASPVKSALTDTWRHTPEQASTSSQNHSRLKSRSPQRQELPPKPVGLPSKPRSDRSPERRPVAPRLEERYRPGETVDSSRSGAGSHHVDRNDRGPERGESRRVSGEKRNKYPDEDERRDRYSGRDRYEDDYRDQDVDRYRDRRRDRYMYGDETRRDRRREDEERDKARSQRQSYGNDRRDYNSYRPAYEDEYGPPAPPRREYGDGPRGVYDNIDASWSSGYDRNGHSDRRKSGQYDDYRESDRRRDRDDYRERDRDRVQHRSRSPRKDTRDEAGHRRRSKDESRDYDRRRSYGSSKSPVKRRESPIKKSRKSPTPTPTAEEGEIEEEEDRPPTPSVSPPDDPIANFDSQNLPDPSANEYNPRKLTMRNRPNRPSSNKNDRRPLSPPLGPSDEPSDTPPPPPETPPPPPEPYTPTPPAPPSPTSKPVSGQGAYEQLVPPSAPNPNLLNGSTRPPTPAQGTKIETPGFTFNRVPKNPKRRTVEEELLVLHREFKGTSSLEAYDEGSKLGEGTFGIVTKGVQKSTKRAVALKHLLTHNPRDGVSTTTIREIKILKSLSHPNVVPILDMVVHPNRKTNRQDIFMVFPFMDHDLCGLLGNRHFRPSVSTTKLIVKQMLEGLAYIHANNIVHRDIKTANILVDKKGVVMIADFGLARSWTGDGSGGEMPKHMSNEYTNMVVTRWYRAPELLLGDTHYGPAVDMWSMGCILGEMYHHEPILGAKGHTDDGQLPLIIEHCGPLNDETFPGWSDLPGYPDMKDRRWDKLPLGEPISSMAQMWNMDECSTNLLIQMLTLDPVRRITADEALDHPWFWADPLPATTAKTNLGVESSHEMGIRAHQQAVAPPPAYRPQPQHRHYRPPPPTQNLSQGPNSRGFPSNNRPTHNNMGNMGNMGQMPNVNSHPAANPYAAGPGSGVPPGPGYARPPFQNRPPTGPNGAPPQLHPSVPPPSFALAGGKGLPPPPFALQSGNNNRYSGPPGGYNSRPPRPHPGGMGAGQGGGYHQSSSNMGMNGNLYGGGGGESARSGIPTGPSGPGGLKRAAPTGPAGERDDKRRRNVLPYDDV